MSALILQAACAATAQQQFARGALYVVATPIGNLADISLRAVQALAEVDAWACEDTRVSAHLMRHLGLDKPLIALHEHNEASAAERLVERLRQGQTLAYVSDAGTPAVSDPGALLVAQVRQAGFRVVPLPGASAVLTALCVAGDALSQGFVFHGFLPPKANARREALQHVRDSAATQVMFEAPHRIEALAGALGEALGGRPITLCRELTKQFECVHSCRADEASAWLAGDEQRRRGEFVVVVHAEPARPAVDDDAALAPQVEHTLAVLLAELPLKQAVKLAEQISGAPRNALYTRALALRGAAPAADDQDLPGVR